MSCCFSSDEGFSPTLSLGILQQYYEELGLSAFNKPDMKYADIDEFFDQIQKMEPELLEDIVQIMRDNRKRELEEAKQNNIEWINADETLSDEDKAMQIEFIEMESVREAESGEILDVFGAPITAERVDPNTIVTMIEQSDENKQEGWRIWSKFTPENWLSTRITMTAEEGTEFASLYTDIETYVQECNVKLHRFLL